MKKIICIIMAILLPFGFSIAATPINIILPVTPGGPMNQMALSLSQSLTDNQISSVITFHPGGDGIISYNNALKEKDNVILITAISFTVFSNVLAKRESLYTKNMSLIAPVIRTSMGFMISNKFSKDAKISNIEELVEYAKTRPVLCGVSASHGKFELTHMNQNYRTKFEYVPYKGSAEYRTNLIGGQLDCAFDSIGSQIPFHNNKDFKILATATTTSGLDVPSISTALPGYAFDNWFGFAIPNDSNLLSDKKLIEILQNFYKSEYLKPMVKNLGIEPAKSNKNINQEIESSIKKYETMIIQ